MSRNKTSNRSFSLDSLLENKKILFVFSLLVAVIFWGMVSMVNTKEEERVFPDVKVQLIDTEKPLEQYGLSVFDQNEKNFMVNVTLKGYSYQLREIKSDNIVLTASCASVAAAGSIDLPVEYSLSGVNNSNVRVVKLSADKISVNFDKEVKKSFNIVEDIEEKEGYSLAEGCKRENPILSAETVTISGASTNVAKIVTVKAHVELDKPMSSSKRLEAELVLESDTGVLDKKDFDIHLDGPVYITIPVNHTGTYEATVDFTNMPQYYKTNEFAYTVDPPTVDVTSMTSVDEDQTRNNQVTVGVVDFYDIAPGTVNKIPLKFDAGNGESTYVVTIDTTDLTSVELSVPVDVSNITLPSNITVDSAEVASVTVVGPKEKLEGIDRTAVYAVPMTDGLSAYTAGTHSVYARIMFRTLTDCWAYGKYTIDITVK